ncbi:hypothetical protein GGX14DRAFT_581273 [Mycena pura]|uniref:Uncharacterized protein n=1 Tax=Mycena pura TaxID=153505 RepID=A0AAD6UJA6_9AGAR|nr:hypothetical protein GGX14DRAFT_581273 [Mycena pura]
MTPPSTLSAQPSPSLEPPLTAGHLLKPLDFSSTQTLFLFPTMSSKMKGSSIRDPDPVDDAFYVAPTASRFWSAFNHSGTRLFVNVLRKLSANVDIPANVASNAMNVGIRATRYLFAQLSDTEPPEDILALVGLVHQLCELVPDAPSEYLRIPALSPPVRPFYSLRLICSVNSNPGSPAPRELSSPLLGGTHRIGTRKRAYLPSVTSQDPGPTSSIANQQDDDGEEEQDEEDDDGDFEMERPGKTPTPPLPHLTMKTTPCLASPSDLPRLRLARSH